MNSAPPPATVPVPRHPPAWWLRWRYALYGGLTALLVFIGLAAHGGWWERLGVEHMRPFYADTVTTLAAAETWNEGGDPYANNYRDPYRRPHSYGPWWLWSARLGLERRDAWWLGTLLAVAFIATAAAVLAPRTAGGAIWLVLGLCSPPALLGLERANSDLVIVVMLALAGWLAGRSGSKMAECGAAATIVSAAALKFYPLVSLVALAVRPGALRWRFHVGLAAGLVFTFLFWLQADHYARALSEAARPISVFTYGIPLAPMSWRLLEALRGWLLLGAAPFLVAGAILLWRNRRMFWELFPETGGRVAAAIGGATAWLLCYALTTNFPYRALLLFLVLPFWLSTRAGRAGRWLAGLLYLGFWLQAPKYWLAPPEMLAVPAFKKLMAVISGADQAVMAAISFSLVLSLSGWVWRRVRGAPVR